MASKQKVPQIFILLFLFSFSNVLGLMYSAALPDLTAFFGVSKSSAQQTLVLYFAGFGLGQLIYGPLSSAIGRKNAIYIGCSIAILGSLLCIFAIKEKLFFLLLIARLMTALGAACGLSMTFTMISDVFDHTEARQKISVLLGGFAFFPAVGIYIGGLLTHYYSWESCFYFMAFYSLFILTLTLFLPETLKERDISHLHPIRMLQTYFSHFKHSLFLFCSMILGVSGGVIYIFAAEAPYIATNQLKISPDLFGLLNLIPFFGLFLGGFFSSYISNKFTPKALILIGALIYFISSVFMFISFEIGFITASSLFIFPLVIFFSFPMIFSSSSLLGISISPHKSYASSLINFLQIMVGFLIMEIIFFFPADNANVLPLVYSIIGIILLILCAGLKFLPTEES